MNLRKLLKLLHITGTVWLALCAAFLLIVALRHAGVGWWVVFSLGGYSSVAFFLLLSIYLFAIFRGVTRKQMSREHPLTTSPIYILFYDLCPLLGTLAGLVSIYTISANNPLEKISIIVEGTLAMTFLVWIFGDPIISLAEGALPSSTAFRQQRLARARQDKKKREKEKQALLAKIHLSDQSAQEQWNQVLIPLAGELADKLTTIASPSRELKYKAIEFGARAWQLGGTACMHHLIELVNEQLHSKNRSPNVHLAFWWDGIGMWRKPALHEVFTKTNTT